MWFEGLTIHGMLVVVCLALLALGFIALCTWPWLKEWYLTTKNKR